MQPGCVALYPEEQEKKEEDMRHTGPGTGMTQEDAATATFRKITVMLIPYIFVCYLFNYLDRVNVGFAKLQMLDSLHMSETAYGFGAGVFFLGYIAFGLPSNLILAKIGPRRWLATIMTLWGLLSTALLFVHSAPVFYVLRFLTGLAEAGFFPGMVDLSCAVSHVTSEASSRRKTSMPSPSRTVGSPSSKKSHCQASSPQAPPENLPMIVPDNGPPSTPDSGMAAINNVMARPCRYEGNQRVRYTTMPGKNPASARPVRKRST